MSLILSLILLNLPLPHIIKPLMLIIFWLFLFKPFKLYEMILFFFGFFFIIIPNHITLKQQIFTFNERDFLLMPCYEPFMWGFYFLFLKRINDRYRPQIIPKISKKALSALFIVMLAFQFPKHLNLTVNLSGLLTMCLFHTRHDLQFGISALLLGTIVELFGVWNGLWWYPKPDIFGLPFWYIGMWWNVGVLVYRIAMPLARAIENTITRKKTNNPLYTDQEK